MGAVNVTLEQRHLLRRYGFQVRRNEAILTDRRRGGRGGGTRLLLALVIWSGVERRLVRRKHANYVGDTGRNLSVSHDMLQDRQNADS